MRFLTVWRIRSIRGNLMHTATNVLAVTFFFSLMTWTTLYPECILGHANIDGDGLARYLVGFTQYSTLLACGFLLFNLFALSVIARQDEYRVLYYAGASVAQLLRSFFWQAVWLDCAGALLGIPLGLVLVQLFLRDQTVYFGVMYAIQNNPRLLLKSAVLTLLVVPITIFFATWFVLPRQDHGQRSAQRPNDLFRRTLILRIFGVGGAYASLIRRRRIGPRFSLMAAFMLVVFTLPVMCNTLQIIGNAPMRVQTEKADYYLNTFCDASDTTFMPKLDRLLEDFRADGSLVDATVCRFYELKAYCILDDRLMTEAYTETRDKRSIVPADSKYNTCFALQDGRTMLYRPLIAFLDDESFAKAMQRSGVDVGQEEDGALLYNVGLCRGEYVSLLRGDVQADVTLCCLPDSFKLPTDRSDDSARKKNMSILARDERFDAPYYAHCAAHMAKRIPVRIIGTTQSDPCNMFAGRCALVFPERMRDGIASSGVLDGYVKCMRAALKTKDGSAVYSVLKNKGEWLSKNRGCDFQIHFFAQGTNKDFAHPNAPSKIVLSDLDMISEKLWAFQKQTPLCLAYYSLMMAFLLVTNIVDVVHISALVRQKERLMLDSIGMERRQRAGILLYESTLYSVRCVLLSILLFWLLYPLFGLATLQGLTFEMMGFSALDIGISAGSLPDNPFYQSFWVLYRHIMLMTWQAFRQWWWVFFGASALIFISYFAANDVANRRAAKNAAAMLLQNKTDE